MKLLLAEDDAILADALSSSLAKAGFEVEVAPNGAVAEFLLLRQNFDVGVLDLGLPMVDGLTVLKRVRASKPALPMLVLTRRWAMFGGWLLGTLALALLSWLLVGTQGCQNYLRILFLFADASANSATFFKSWKYVDLNSFARALFGAQSALRWMSVVLVVALALPWFALVWWRTAHARAEYQPLVWAGTISATLVFNIYLGIYDVTLVVLSVMLTASVLYRWANRRSFTFPTAYKLILVALYLVPWVTQPIARMIGVQLLTLVLLWLTIYQFNLLGEAAPRTRSI